MLLTKSSRFACYGSSYYARATNNAVLREKGVLSPAEKVLICQSEHFRLAERPWSAGVVTRVATIYQRQLKDLAVMSGNASVCHLTLQYHVAP